MTRVTHPRRQHKKLNTLRYVRRRESSNSSSSSSTTTTKTTTYTHTHTYIYIYIYIHMYIHSPIYHPRVYFVSRGEVLQTHTCVSIILPLKTTQTRARYIYMPIKQLDTLRTRLVIQTQPILAIGCGKVRQYSTNRTNCIFGSPSILLDMAFSYSYPLTLALLHHPSIYLFYTLIPFFFCTKELGISRSKGNITFIK